MFLGVNGERRVVPKTFEVDQRTVIEIRDMFLDDVVKSRCPIECDVLLTPIHDAEIVHDVAAAKDQHAFVAQRICNRIRNSCISDCRYLLLSGNREPSGSTLAFSQ